MSHVLIPITGKEGPDAQDIENTTTTDERSASPTGIEKNVQKIGCNSKIR